MVRRERNSFRSVLKETSDVLKQMFTSNDNFLPPLTWPITTLDITAHYSFDYAQQVKCLLMYDVISFLHLIGKFSQQPTTARSTVFPNSTQMWNIRDML